MPKYFLFALLVFSFLNFIQINSILSKKLSYLSGTAGTNNLFGIIEDYKGNYDGSIEYYLKAVELYYSIGNQKSAARIISNAGISCENQHKFDKSLEYARDALSRYKIIHDTLGIIKVYNSIGGLFSTEYFNQNDKAQEYFKKSIQLCEIINEKNILDILN